MCPGGPSVCVQCAPGVYTPSASFCSCTSGTWACAAPTGSQVQCPDPVANSDFYVDPSCTVPYAVEVGAGDASSCDAGGARILASSYDQTCTSDSDCAEVSEGDPCNPCDFSCSNAAINVRALAQYGADTAGIYPAAYTLCPSSCGGPETVCCSGGTCHRGDPTCPLPSVMPADAGE